MMKKLLVLIILLFPVMGLAQTPITLPASGNWTSSFNCGPSDFVYSSEVNFPSGYCAADGIPDGQGGGAPVVSCVSGSVTNWSGVYTAASRAADGTRGNRQWLGPASTNGMTLTFTTTSTLEIRWYERYASLLYAGYEANGALHKDLYINQGTSTWVIPEIYGSDYNVAVETQGNNSIPNTGNHASIATLMDGNWHLYELHLDPTSMQMWVDGVQLCNYSYNPGGSYSTVIIGDNTGDPPNDTWGATCGAVDFDDIAINKTGAYIGPAGSGTSYTLSVTDSGSGTVSGDGINCVSGSDVCSTSISSGVGVTLTESPADGYTFTGWSGGTCSGASSTCSFTMPSSAVSVTATFVQNTYALTVTKAGTGTGTVTSSPSGISCGATCAYSFPLESVVLTATAGLGSSFTGWSSGTGSAASCSGIGTCSMTITQTSGVTATFTAGTIILPWHH